MHNKVSDTGSDGPLVLQQNKTLFYDFFLFILCKSVFAIKI